MATSRSKNNPNWLEVKKEYITDPAVTYQALADKHKVGVRTVKRWALKDGWQAARAEVAREVSESVTKKAVDEMSEVNERHTKAYRNLQAFALTNLNILMDYIRTEIATAQQNGKKITPREIYNSQQAKFLAETLRISMDGERITLGLPTVVTKGEQDVRLTSEFEDRPVEELEKLFKAVDASDETNTAASTKS